LNGTYKYDFSTDSSQVYGGTAGAVPLSEGKWGMSADNANADGNIDSDDKNDWRIEAGKHDYLNADMNMDGQINNLDINEFWINHIFFSCQVPE
jgi:hypothetical protein